MNSAVTCLPPSRGGSVVVATNLGLELARAATRFIYPYSQPIPSPDQNPIIHYHDVRSQDSRFRISSLRLWLWQRAWPRVAALRLDLLHCPISAIAPLGEWRCYQANAGRPLHQGAIFAVFSPPCTALTLHWSAATAPSSHHSFFSIEQVPESTAIAYLRSPHRYLRH